MKYYTNKYYRYQYMIELFKVDTDGEEVSLGFYDNEWELAEKRNLTLFRVKNILGRVRSFHNRWYKYYFSKTLNCYIRLVKAY